MLEPHLAPICGVMSRDIISARPEMPIAEVVDLMMSCRVGCLPIVDQRKRPIGVITKFDLVEQLHATMRGGCCMPSDLEARVAEDAMMPLAITLDEHATVVHAAAMMRSEDTHHVLVVDADGVLVGVVSAKDIVDWVAEHEIPPLRRIPRGTKPPAWRPLEG